MTREEVIVSVGMDNTSVERGLGMLPGMFEKGLSKVTSTVKNAARDFLAGWGFEQLSGKLDEVFTRVDRISNRSSALNVSTNFLQDIENVAKASGIAGERVEDMLFKFTKTLPAGSDVEQSFYALADRLAAIPDPAERARAAVEAFGRAGADMLAITSKGSAGVKDLAGQFSKFSDDDIKAIKEAHENIENVKNTISVAVGKSVGWIAHISRVAGAASQISLFDQIAGNRSASGEVAQQEAGERAAAKKTEDDRRKAEAIAASQEQHEADLKIYSQYAKKKQDYDLQQMSPENRKANLALMKVTEQRELDASKTYAEQIAHKTKILEIDEQIAEVNKQISDAAKEQKKQEQEAANIRAEALNRISELGQRETEKFMPTLEELAHHGGAAGRDARQVERLDRRIKRDFFRGDVAGAHTDIASRNKIYDSLAARGILPGRSEARETLDIVKRANQRLSEMGTKSQPLFIKANMG